MTKQDYYDVLGVTKNADKTDIKKAFRKLAMKYHPDKNSGDKQSEKKFKELNEAYEVLSNTEKRSAYDQMGHAAFDQTGGGGFGAQGFGNQGFDFNFSSGEGFGGVFDDILKNFMGGGREGSQQTHQRGSDLRYNLEISLEDAFKGITSKINYSTLIKCEECNGSGAQKNTNPKTCPKCNGYGKVRVQQGFFSIERTCSTCHGRGQIIENPCNNCHGNGCIKSKKTIQAKIPPGVGTNSRIRLSKEGEAGIQGGPPGDLYIYITVREHNLFHREHNDIHCQVPISMALAALGGAIEVPTIDGSKTKLKIPSGTQSDQQFRFRNKGMSILQHSRRGDMFIHINVETPVNLSKKQVELLEQFEKAGNGTPINPKSSNFFDKVKKFWEN